MITYVGHCPVSRWGPSIKDKHGNQISPIRFIDGKGKKLPYQLPSTNITSFMYSIYLLHLSNNNQYDHSENSHSTHISQTWDADSSRDKHTSQKKK